MFLGAHPGTLYFPYRTRTASALDWPYCVRAFCVSHSFLLCAPQSLVPGGRCSTHRLKDFERFPGIGPTVRSALVTQHMPIPMMHQDRLQGFSFIVLVHLDCGAELPSMKPQPCLLLVASGLLLRL